MVNNTTSPTKRAIESSGQLNNRLLAMLDDLERINHHLNVSLGMTRNPESRIEAFFRYQLRKKKIIGELAMSIFGDNKLTFNKKTNTVKSKQGGVI